MTTSAIISQEQFQNMPLEESTAVATGSYFSNLDEEQLMTLFCKTPSFRFEFCSVFYKKNRFSKRRNMYGFIQAAECPDGCFSPDMASSSHYVFNRESNDPIPVPHSCLFLRDISCSIPASNYVQINAKLYVIAATEKDENMDLDKLVIVETEENVDDIDKDCVVNHFQVLSYYTYGPRGSVTLKSKDVVENDNKYDMEVYKELEKCNLNIPPQNIKKPIDLNENEPFEVCDGNLVINLSDGCSGSKIIKGNGGSLNLYYVALKYVVDAALELEFIVASNETKLNGTIKYFYGNNFDYGCRRNKKTLYKARLLDIKPDGFVKSGKLNLKQYVLALPAQFSLIIEIYLSDHLTGEYVLKGLNEFFVPRNGSSSYGSMVGIGK